MLFGGLMNTFMEFAASFRMSVGQVLYAAPTRRSEAEHMRRCLLC